MKTKMLYTSDSINTNNSCIIDLIDTLASDFATSDIRDRKNIDQ